MDCMCLIVLYTTAMSGFKRLAAFLIALTYLNIGLCQFAVKSNLLYDATTTPNLGAEYAVGFRNTVNLVYGLNPWSFDHGQDRKMAKHWTLMPEYRWWTCSAFNGHFFGIHAMGGEFNAANVNLPIPGGFFSGENLRSGVRDHRYQGKYLGAGVTYGYQYSIARHLNLEAEIGVGYDHVWYDKFACGECGSRLAKGGTNYVGVTKLGLSLLYIF